MKKAILFLALSLCLLSCSNDDSTDNCQAARDEIIHHYDTQIEYVMNNPGPNGIDYQQIALLNQERDHKLSEACN